MTLLVKSTTSFLFALWFDVIGTSQSLVAKCCINVFLMRDRGVLDSVKSGSELLSCSTCRGGWGVHEDSSIVFSIEIP